MSSINETKSNIETALFEFLKTKTDKSEEEILKLSKKFLEQIESKLHKSQLPSEILINLENAEHNQPIYLKGINFVSLCEHHLLPFIGLAKIAVYPNRKIAGVSKFSELVSMLSNSLTLQESLTENIAVEIQKALDPKGVMVKISANHMCSSLLNTENSHTKFETTYSTGIYEIDHTLRNEALLNF